MEANELHNFLIDLKCTLAEAADKFNAPPSRDVLAARAMQGLIAQGACGSAREIAERAYEAADAMLFIRAKDAA